MGLTTMPKVKRKADTKDRFIITECPPRQPGGEQVENIYAYAPGLIEKIMAANDLVDEVSEVVELQQSNGDYVGVCPFHHEKIAYKITFKVSRKEQKYSCSGCENSGDVVDFVSTYHELTTHGTIVGLAERAGISLAFEIKEHKP